MATTYDLAFDFRLALFKLTARKKYNDSIRSDASYLIDLAQKLGALSMGNTTGLGDAVAGGASMAHVAEYDITASGTATIDLQSLTLVDERTAPSPGRS